MKDFNEFENALETLEIVTRFNMNDLKTKYQNLSKEYHPDMPNGNIKKFQELNKAYKMLQNYLKEYRFGIDEEEFYRQKPFLRQQHDWFYNTKQKGK